MMGEKPNFSEASSSAIKEEVCEYSSNTGSTKHHAGKILISRKKSVVQRRQFTVNIGDQNDHVVSGEIHSNVLSALKSVKDISDKIDKMKENNKVPYLIGKTGIEGYINLGMPLKCLPKDSNTEMMFYNKDKTTDEYYREDPGKEKWILFYIRPLGRRYETKRAQKRKITKCKDLENYNLCVFAPENETIKDALCKDGRFMPLLNDIEWKLEESGKFWGNNLHVDKNLDKKIFEMKLKIDPKGNRGSDGLHREQNIQASHEGMAVSSGICKDPNEEQVSCVSVEANSESQAKTCSNKKQALLVSILPSAVEQQYPCFREQRDVISSSFRESRAQKKLRKEFLIARREEFDKVTKNSSLIKILKILIDLSKSVGYIEWGTNRKEGCATCFVLCNRYILTNRHVINMIVGEEIKNQWANKISNSAYVTFSYEDKHPINSDWFFLEPWLGITDGEQDFAVLRLKENEKIPDGLVHLSSPPPSNGLIYIIGHPDGEAKSMDGCSLVGIAKREKECNWRLLQEKEYNGFIHGINSIHMFTPRSFSDMINSHDKVTYDTTFFHGSSGSPVFDQNGKLIALHTGGYTYEAEGKKHSVIEFGFTMHSILSEIEKKHKQWYDSEIRPFIQECPGRAEATLPSECTDVEMKDCS